MSDLRKGDMFWYPNDESLFLMVTHDKYVCLVWKGAPYTSNAINDAGGRNETFINGVYVGNLMDSVTKVTKS